MRKITITTIALLIILVNTVPLYASYYTYLPASEEVLNVVVNETYNYPDGDYQSHDGIKIASYYDQTFGLEVEPNADIELGRVKADYGVTLYKKGNFKFPLVVQLDIQTIPYYSSYPELLETMQTVHRKGIFILQQDVPLESDSNKLISFFFETNGTDITTTHLCYLIGNSYENRVDVDFVQDNEMHQLKIFVSEDGKAIFYLDSVEVGMKNLTYNMPNNIQIRFGSPIPLGGSPSEYVDKGFFLDNITISARDTDTDFDGIYDSNDFLPKFNNTLFFVLVFGTIVILTITLVSRWKKASKKVGDRSETPLPYSAPSTPPPSPAYYPPAKISEEEVEELYDLEEGGHVYGFGDFFAYKIDKNIGSGGFSEVYLVKSQKDGRSYAMKVPNNANIRGESTIELSREDIEKYGKEAKIWSSLTQKAGDAVVNLIDVGVRPFPWFVMELAETSLGKKMKGMNREEKLEVTRNLLSKLEKIHGMGVVHKDIKPENVLYAGGEWKFTDFGLSKTIDKSSKSSTTMSGTWFYMAPEQVSKKFGHTDHRTDIWQMGVMLYKMFTGHYPFESDDAFEATSAILHDEPVPGTEYGMDEKLWDIVKKALQKKKEDRWQSAEEFKKALEGLKRDSSKK